APRQRRLDRRRLHDPRWVADRRRRGRRSRERGDGRDPAVRGLARQPGATRTLTRVIAATEAVAVARRRYDDAVRAVAALPVIESLAGAHVCVTGFTGQAGSALVRVLAEANRTILADRPARVTGVARRPSATPTEGIDAVYLDVADGP